MAEEDPRAAITNLVFTYAERIDAGDFESVAELFADAHITSEGTTAYHEGVDAVLAMYTGTTRRYADGTPHTKHVTTNLLIEIDTLGKEATCRSYFTVLQAVPGELALQPIIAGRYIDRFERVLGTWRFAARHMIVDLVGDLSKHLLFELPADRG
jgi:3-phenylpropionate/cinnamic acid dioxygenase small subunit